MEIPGAIKRAETETQILLSVDGFETQEPKGTKIIGCIPQPIGRL